VLWGSTAGITVVATLFHLYGAGVSPFTALVQRPVHLALMAVLGFLGVGISARPGPASTQSGLRQPDRTGWRMPIRDRVVGTLSALLSTGALLSCAYLVTQHQELVNRAGAATNLDLAAGAVALIVVLELARRATGWGLVVVALLSLGYAMTGPYLPGVLAHRGYGPRRLLEHLYLSTEGIWGIPLGVSADFVFLFILFGAILELAGGGTLLIGLADRVTARSRGGPAKTASLASALMGSLSGSAVANVVTTGAFTIPIMRRAGFKPYFAGAIEAAASTGGQLVPPVMGAGAFILATWTNIPYRTVAVAAVIPAALYYVALLAAIHFRAGKMGLASSGSGRGGPVLPRLHLLLPLVAIVFLLAQGRSPMRAAFWGVVTAVVTSLVRPNTRLGREEIRGVLTRTGSGAVQVAAACAAAGVVVGVASLTGIGLRMSEFVITVSQGQLLPAMLLTAGGSIVLGMGLPTTAAYVVLAALGAPALTELGVPLLAAHLFIFYFGCISNVTPPVSLAAYAAAGIAGSPPIKTAISGMVLASAGFLVPFMFIFAPGLLLQGGVWQVILASASGVIGVISLAAANMGFLRRDLVGWERVLLGVGAFAVMTPGLAGNGVGLGALALVLLRSRGVLSPTGDVEDQ
jgi:TRAP transporter 4TM/12TM fusion protein